MSPQTIAQLAIVLAPIVESFVVEGGKVVATFRANLTQDDINKALDASKSATWSTLNFAQ